jgi:predicted permease
MNPLLLDLRYALRTLRKSPGFAAVVVFTLALGIGANTAIFSVVDAVLLRPLPFPEPERVMHVAWGWNGNRNTSMPPYNFAIIREQNRAFDGLATYLGFAAALEDDGVGAEVRGLRVSEDFFRVVGVQPTLGRAFLPEENLPHGPTAVVLSHEFWRSNFGGEAGVVGRPIRIDGTSYTVTGVLPPGFRFPGVPGTDVIVPLQLVADPRDRGFNYPVIGRLQAGVTKAQAAADLRRVFEAIRQEHPGLVEKGMTGPEPASFRDTVSPSLSLALWVLLGAVGVVLLIACVNIAGLLLARAAERQREISIRAALGAGRRRIVRQLLTESVLLSMIAGAVALLFAVWGMDLLRALAPAGIPRLGEAGLDWRVLGFTVVVALATGIAFGLAAGVPATRPNLTRALNQGGRGGAGGLRTRGRDTLIVAEVALSVVLLAGAALLISNLLRLGRVDPGFEPENVVTARFPRTPEGYGTVAPVWRLTGELLERVRAMPGVSAAASASNLPLERGLNFPMSVEGRPDATMGNAEWRAVSPEYFRTLEIAVPRGREFTAADAESGAPVILINEAMARLFWGADDPVGDRIALGTMGGEPVIPGFSDPAREIVGVVADIREANLGEPARPTVYVPQAQVPEMLVSLPALLVRTSGSNATGAAVRAAVRELDPRIPEPSIRTLEQVVGASVAPQRFNSLLMGTFAGLALLLTAVGLYGVIAYSVRQRTREFGVRLALGAKPGDVRALVLGRGARLAAIGVAIGLFGAFALTRVLSSLVSDMSAPVPVTFAAVVALQLGVALLASYLPARRATRVDPMVAFRAE